MAAQEEGRLITEIPYLEALARFRQVIPPSDFSSLHILTTKAEVEAWERATGNKARVLVLTTPTAPMVVFLHPVRRSDGSWGVYQQVARTEIYGGKAVVLFPLWTDEKGVRRVVLVKHQRPTLHQHAQGGWELEVPSFSQRPGKSVVQSIEEEVLAEGNLHLLANPQRLDAEGSPGCPMLPGITSEFAEVWLAHVTPNSGDPKEDREGITGRILWTKEEFEEALRRGYVEVDGQRYLTNLFHNLVAAQFATLRGIW